MDNLSLVWNRKKSKNSSLFVWGIIQLAKNRISVYFCKLLELNATK